MPTFKVEFSGGTCDAEIVSCLECVLSLVFFERLENRQSTRAVTSVLCLVGCWVLGDVFPIQDPANRRAGEADHDAREEHRLTVLCRDRGQLCCESWCFTWGQHIIIWIMTSLRVTLHLSSTQQKTLLTDALIKLFVRTHTMPQGDIVMRKLKALPSDVTIDWT